MTFLSFPCCSSSWPREGLQQNHFPKICVIQATFHFINLCQNEVTPTNTMKAPKPSRLFKSHLNYLWLHTWCSQKPFLKGHLLPLFISFFWFLISKACKPTWASAPPTHWDFTNVPTYTMQSHVETYCALMQTGADWGNNSCLKSKSSPGRSPHSLLLRQTTYCQFFCGSIFSVYCSLLIKKNMTNS